MSKQISRMTGRGLVEREDCATDGRGAFAVLTKAGQKTIEAAAPLHAEQVRRWFAVRRGHRHVVAGRCAGMVGATATHVSAFPVRVSAICVHVSAFPVRKIA